MERNVSACQSRARRAERGAGLGAGLGAERGRGNQDWKIPNRRVNQLRSSFSLRRPVSRSCVCFLLSFRLFARSCVHSSLARGRIKKQELGFTDEKKTRVCTRNARCRFECTQSVGESHRSVVARGERETTDE